MGGELPHLMCMFPSHLVVHFVSTYIPWKPLAAHFSYSFVLFRKQKIYIYVLKVTLLDSCLTYNCS